MKLNATLKQRFTIWLNVLVLQDFFSQFLIFLKIERRSKKNDETDVPYRCILEQDEVCMETREENGNIKQTLSLQYFCCLLEQNCLMKSTSNIFTDNDDAWS